MSILLMTAAFKAELPSTQKFVLVALCDSANDQGECYPSVQVVMEKCSLSERSVQGAISRLEELGFVRREFRNGRSTVYWISTHPRSTCTPAPSAPPQDMHPTPARRAPPPPQHVHPTPAARAPITINEPSLEPSRKQKKTAVPASVLVDAGFDESVAEEFIAHKAAMKSPLTSRAWDDHVREAQKAGWSALQAAEKVMAKNWRGFEAKYVANETPGRGPPAETSYARSMREKYEQATPLIAAKPPEKRLNPMDVLDGLTRISDRPNLHEMRPGVRPGLPGPVGGFER